MCEARALKEALSEGVVRKEEVSKGLHLKGSVQFEHKLSNRIQLLFFLAEEPKQQPYLQPSATINS